MLIMQLWHVLTYRDTTLEQVKDAIAPDFHNSDGSRTRSWKGRLTTSQRRRGPSVLRSRHALISLSQDELNRLEAIQKIRDHRLSVVQAAELLHLSRSQLHRLLQAYDQDGAGGLIEGTRSAEQSTALMRTSAIPHSIWCAIATGTSAPRLPARSCLNGTSSRSAARRC